MKRIKLMPLALCAAMLLTACSGSPDNASVADNASVSDSGSDVGSNSTADSESVADSESNIDSESKELTDEERYKEMVERSLMTVGDTARMSKFFEKCEKGEEVTVAFIGGSITYGMTVTPDKCWAKRTYDYLCEQYPDTKINYVNAGISGTPSILGNIRLRRDVLDYSPDLVFVEFAVNDGTDNNYKDSYDALVRTVLAEPQDPAVVLYFTVLKSKYTAEKHMSEVGNAYGLPMISLNNALAPEFESGAMAWEDYSDDESHPNEWGHIFTADLMKNMFQKVKESGTTGEIKPLPSDWVYSDRFSDMIFVDNGYNKDKINITSLGSFSAENPTTVDTFKGGWTVKEKPSNASPMEFTFNGKAMILVYKCAKSGKYGSVKVTVDGKEMGTYNSSKSDGWNNPDIFIVYTGEKGEHTVSLQLCGEKPDSSYYFELLGIGIAQ